MADSTDALFENPRPDPGGVLQRLKRIRISRLLRWLLVIGLGLWVYSNYYPDLPLNQLIEKYATENAQFVYVDGMEVHAMDLAPANAKPVKTVLLLHDDNSSMHTWAGWMDSLQQKGYRTIAVDLPGYGLTGPHPKGSYSLFMYANFLDHFVDTLKLDKFLLVGNGLGAQISWFYAAEYPERIDKLVLLDPPGFEDKQGGLLFWMARTPVLNRLFWKITPPSIIKLMLEDMYADDDKVDKQLIDRHFELLRRPGNRKAFTDRAQVRHNNPPVDLIDKIRCPTLILWGAEDKRLSPEHAYEFHRRVRGALLKIYQNTGHWPQEENPEATLQDVLDFWEGRF